MNKKTVDKIFFIGSLFFGLLIFIFSVYAFKNINKDCTDTTINDCLMINFVLSIGFITISIGYGVCNYFHNCYDNTDTNNIDVIFGISSVVSLVMTMTSFIAYGKINNDNKCLGSDKFSTQDENDNGKRLKIYVLLSGTMSLFLFLLVNGAKIYQSNAFEKLYETIMKKNKEKEESEKEESSTKRIRNPFGLSSFFNRNKKQRDDDEDD